MMLFKQISAVIITATILSACGGGTKNFNEPYQLTNQQANGATQEGEAKKVAFLLPLSGQYKQLGKSMMDAAQLALFDVNAPNLELMPVDTGGDSYSATKATEKALEEGAELILGPVFSATTSKILPVAIQDNVNVISLSNDQALANKKGLFLLGYAPQQQVDRVTHYAASRGIKDYAALVPNNSFGMMTMDAFQKDLAQGLGVLHKTEYYVPTSQSLLGLKQQVSSVKEALPAEGGGQYAGAVLVPEGGKRLGQIAAWLSNADSSKQVQLLGSNQWNETAILGMAGVSGGWFADTNPELQQRFEQRFYSTYGYTPPRLASLAYDAAALAANLSIHGDFGDKMLASPQGFSGVNGTFRFRRDGVSERSLAVLQVDHGVARVIDPAPSRFVN